VTKLGKFFTRWWAVIGVIVAWQLIVMIFQVNAFLIPSPTTIGREITKDPLSFLLPLLLTVRVAIIGFVAGVGLGYLMASLAWLWPIFGAAVTPFALIIRSVPFVALIPVLTRSLGYGDHTAWVIATMVCFFPTFVLVGTGLNDIPANGNDLFSAAGSSRFDRYRLLAVPASLVALATSIRIAASSSIAAALIAGFLMGIPGLALVLSISLDQLDMGMLWGASSIAIVVSIAAYLLASQFEIRVIARWR
jgi:ABC-type nitrate/sulfonate/bicarbonate transport system permease component